MTLGMMPSPLLLQQYDLPQFKNVVSAVKSGNLAAFTQALEQHAEFFIQKGIYLILEGLRSLVFLRLVRRLYELSSSSLLSSSLLFPHCLQVANSR